MSFVNTSFFIFILIAMAVYYLMYAIKPIRKYQWVWLLIVSYGYYLTFGIKTIFFIIYTTLSVYVGGRLISRAARSGKNQLLQGKGILSAEEKKAIKAKTKRKKRLGVVIILLLNFGMLAVVKYSAFFIENVNAIFTGFGMSEPFTLWSIMLPIGISFYTFQSMGYIIDVYQGKYEAETNVLKLALFVSYFPQIMQGPIGRFNRLSQQLFENHSFQLERMEYGLQLLGWGLFKKLVLADRAAVYVNEVFQNYTNYGGWYNVVAVLMYSVQLYADFSGGMDVVMGVSEMFGINLDQNFRQPFFSKSISEFWRRWHITLGTWMKDYIFYPFSLSKASNRMGKFVKKHCGSYLGKTLPICFADLLIFFLVGVWHGAAWKYIAYGMYNGIIIAFSSLMTPVYKKALGKCRINAEGKMWKCFQIFRTFILVNIGWFFDMGVSFAAAMTMMKDTICNMHIGQLTDGVLFSLGLAKKDYLIIVMGCVVWLVVSIVKEKGIDVRVSLASKPLVLRWMVYLALIFSTGIFGYIGATTGFIYAQF